MYYISEGVSHDLYAIPLNNENRIIYKTHCVLETYYTATISPIISRLRHQFHREITETRMAHRLDSHALTLCLFLPQISLKLQSLLFLKIVLRLLASHFE